MQTNETIIERIRRMEFYFDTVSQAVSGGADSALNEPPIKAMLNALTEYYENGQWLADYEADERGELPSDLKRGVLSQDAVYDLLCEIKRRTAEYGFEFSM